MSERRETQMTLAALGARRRERWRQTPQTRIPDADAGARLIEQVGVATLYPASPEIPNLYSAFVGDPDTPTDSKWDSPSGTVYSWRWTLGGRETAFYTALVRRRSTWIRWSALPTMLRLCGELRMPDELYDAGLLSHDAYRITQALDEAGGDLTTGALREAAGFPKGKAQRAAYLRAVEELDTRLLLAQVFAAGETEACHALVRSRFPAHVAEAERLTRADALAAFLRMYLPHAVYAAPAPLARHLKLPEDELRAGLDRLAAQGLVAATALPDAKGDYYVWNAVDEQTR